MYDHQGPRAVLVVFPLNWQQVTRFFPQQLLFFFCFYLLTQLKYKYLLKMWAGVKTC